MENVLEKLSALVWDWPMMGLFLVVGVVYTVRLRGLPLRNLGHALRLIGKGQSGSGISPYAALCTALAATIGTGNIVGVATALAVGGPGALAWMLVAAVFGMATQYAECFLAVRYRTKRNGTFFGGPFCYIEKGLGKKWKPLALMFAALGAGAGLFGVGTVTQMTSITSAVSGFFGGGEKVVILTGGVVTLAAAAVLLGGAKRIAAACEVLVPFMAGLYLLCCGVILVRARGEILPAIRLILQSALSPRAALGAGTGVTVKLALRMGVGRGVFTNEAGLGTSAIAAAAAETDDPVRQGLVGMTATFIDTLVICTLTGLCLVVTGAWSAPLEGVALTDLAWRRGLGFGETLSSFLLMVCLVFFAFATVIGWNFYAERCFCYLVGPRPRAVKLYRAGYLLALGLSPVVSVGAAWHLSDLCNALLALPNLTALLLLQNQVVETTRRRLKKE